MANTWIDEMLEQIQRMTQHTNIDNSSLIDSIRNAYQSGDYRALQGIFAGSGFRISPEQEKWLDNMIAQQGTLENRAYETANAEQNLLREASQLQKLGLSSSGVLQTGGVMPNAVATADNSKTNVALQRYSQRMMIAKQLLSMTSSMASAGVYGASLNAAKKASSVLTSAASHSALSHLHYESLAGKSSKKTPPWSKLLKDLELPEEAASPDDLPF